MNAPLDSTTNESNYSLFTIRLIALVAPYVGKEIDPQRYCSQLVLPIEERVSKGQPFGL